MKQLVNIFKIHKLKLSLFFIKDTIYGPCGNIFRARMDSSSNIIDRSKQEELSSDVTETTSSKEKDDTSTEEHTSENGDASEKEDTATKDDTSEIDLTEVKEESKPFTLKHEIPKGVDSTVIIDICKCFIYSNIFILVDL